MNAQYHRLEFTSAFTSGGANELGQVLTAFCRSTNWIMAGEQWFITEYFDTEELCLSRADRSVAVVARLGRADGWAALISKKRLHADESMLVREEIGRPIRRDKSRGNSLDLIKEHFPEHPELKPVGTCWQRRVKGSCLFSGVLLSVSFDTVAWTSGRGLRFSQHSIALQSNLELGNGQMAGTEHLCRFHLMEQWRSVRTVAQTIQRKYNLTYDSVPKLNKHLVDLGRLQCA